MNPASPKEPARPLWIRLETWYRRTLGSSALPRPVVLTLQTIALTIREVVRDQIPVRAAMLSYWSLVAIVPVAVLALALLRPLGLAESESLRSLVYRALLAGPVAEVGVTLDSWLVGIDLARLGVAGLIGVVLTGSRIFFSVEQAYNHLWGVEVRRSIFARFLLFYTTVTLAPLLVAYGFHLSSKIRTGLDVSALSWVLPIFATAAAFTAGIRFLPDTRVFWRPALIGGLVSAALFEAAKVGFNTYVGVLGGGNTASAIYGSLALFPVFLLWLNLLWLIVLFGVKVAYISQWFDALLLAETRRLQNDDAARRHPDVFFALTCLRAVARHFRDGLGPITEAQVTAQAGADPVYVRAALDNLRVAGLVATSETGWLPSVPVEQLSVARVVHLYREVTRPSGVSEPLPKIEDGPVL